MAYLGYEFKDNLASLTEKWEKSHKRKLTQEELSKETFLSQPVISKLKSGTRQLKAEEVELFANFFGVSRWEVITGIAPENADIHEQTGLNEHAILWLKENAENNPDRIKMLNTILSHSEIGDLLMDSLCVFSLAQFYIKTITGIPFGNKSEHNDTFRFHTLMQLDKVLIDIHKLYSDERENITEDKVEDIVEKFFESKDNEKEIREQAENQEAECIISDTVSGAVDMILNNKNLAQDSKTISDSGTESALSQNTDTNISE